MSPTRHVALPRGHGVFRLRHVTPSSRSQSSPLRTAPRESLTNQPCRSIGGDPAGQFPQAQAPQNPNLPPIFSPKAKPERSPAVGFGFQAPSWLQNLVCIKPEQRDGGGGGGVTPEPRPSRLTAGIASAVGSGLAAVAVTSPSTTSTGCSGERVPGGAKALICC